MSKVTALATAQLSAADSITIEMIEANETPAMVRVTWPVQASVFRPDRFPVAAAIAVRVFSEAHTRLAQLKKDGIS